VHIFSAMEARPTYQPWHDKQTHQNFLKPDTGKCLTYYFYFMDPKLGLCFVRVPMWAPFTHDRLLQWSCLAGNSTQSTRS
jgi:hypothetical protein